MTRTLAPPSRFRRRGVSEAVEGKLTMELDHLVFTPEPPGEEARAIPLRDVERVRRGRGSPVIELRLGNDEKREVVWFYFVSPPKLPPGGSGRGVRYMWQSRASGPLGLANAMWGDEVSSWYTRIREQAGR